jgi:hypothetical protein
MPVLNIASVGISGFQWYLTGLSSIWDSKSYQMAGIGPKPVTDGQTALPDIWGTVYPPTPPGASNITSWATAYGFNSGQTYTVYAFVKTPNGSYYNAGVNMVTMQMARPPSFTWYSPKVSEEAFQVSALEWNALTGRINEFREYKKLPYFSFFEPPSGMDFAAWIFNQAVSALADMYPPVTPPGAVLTGSEIHASQLNGLVSSINSIY